MAQLSPQCNVCSTTVDEEPFFTLSCAHFMCNRCFKSLSTNQTVFCAICLVISSIRNTDLKQQLNSSLSSSTSHTENTTTQNPKVAQECLTNRENDPGMRLNEIGQETNKKGSFNEINKEESKINPQAVSRRVKQKIHVFEESNMDRNEITNYIRSHLQKESIFPKPLDALSPIVAKIVCANNPHSIYVQIMDEDVEHFDYVDHQLQLECRKPKEKENIVRLLQPGYPCAVFLNGRWNRAIIELAPPDCECYQVFCVDTGHRDQVGSKRIRRLPSRFMVLPAQAVRCKLNCFSPVELKQSSQIALGGTHFPIINSRFYWPNEIVNLIKTKVNKAAQVTAERIFIGRIGKFHPGAEEHFLMTTIYILDESDSLNQQVNDAFLKVFANKNHPYNKLVPAPYATQKACGLVQEKKAAPAKAVISRKKDKLKTRKSSAVGDCIYVTVTQIPELTPKHSISSPSTVREASFSPCCPSSPRTCQSLPEQSPTRYKFWNFPVPETTLTPCFKGVVTWVDSKGYLYIHDSKWTKQLKIIRDRLNATFNQTKPSPCDFQVGDPCVVKFKGDWFRAIVKNASVHDSTISVFLVDYGATGTFKSSEVRREVITTKVPVQTYRCSLHNLVSKSFDHLNNPIWSKDTVKFLYELAVNVEFNVKIHSYSPLVVILNFSSNSVNLADFVVAARNDTRHVTHP